MWGGFIGRHPCTYVVRIIRFLESTFTTCQNLYPSFWIWWKSSSRIDSSKSYISFGIWNRWLWNMQGVCAHTFIPRWCFSPFLAAGLGHSYVPPHSSCPDHVGDFGWICIFPVHIDTCILPVSYLYLTCIFPVHIDNLYLICILSVSYLYLTCIFCSLLLIYRHQLEERYGGTMPNIRPGVVYPFKFAPGSS